MLEDYDKIPEDIPNREQIENLREMEYSERLEEVDFEQKSGAGQVNPAQTRKELQETKSDMERQLLKLRIDRMEKRFADLTRPWGAGVAPVEYGEEPVYHNPEAALAKSSLPSTPSVCMDLADEILNSIGDLLGALSPVLSGEEADVAQDVKSPLVEKMCLIRSRLADVQRRLLI